MGALPILVVAAACQAGPKACSTVGLAPGGLKVDVSRVMRAHPSAELVVRVCLGRRQCHTVHPRSSMVSVGTFTGASPVRVSVRISTSHGRKLFGSATRVEPVKLQPNGPSCPPQAWVAAVRAEHQHRLVAVPLVSDTGRRPVS